MLTWHGRLVALGILALVLMSGCAGPTGSPADTPQPSDTIPAIETPVAPTSTPPLAATATRVPPTTSTSSHQTLVSPTPGPTGTMASTTTPIPTEIPKLITLMMLEGSKARYRVKEQFARRNFPNDAVGETSDVEGTIVLDSNGEVQSDRSKITVNMQTLRSDDDDRDDFLRTDALETDRFPLAEFVVEQVPGLPWPLPEGEELQFELQGSMTAHGVTSPVTWQVLARVSDGTVTGQALTNFTFDKFDMKKPSVFFLLSVDDDIRLEVDFVANLQPG